ncbi:MAG: tRNA threonylcarbamoyladenosine dehydratase [Proteobacteria bacterium]|jgi:tRNA A37 threonylcarbamoyladenosine dehydratase|nr:tRNA threonylcarbamoyladenosine dehydratase [Pseudomonadota bacterium]
MTAENPHYNPETSQPQETKYVLHRRFDRMGRLVGDPAMKKLMNSHVMILGLGGVGSWAAESLMRSGVGQLTIVDFDEICITNANRQIHALQGLVGKKKATVMAERLRKINPQATVKEIPQFYNEQNSEMILAEKPDFVIDAIDNLTAKTHLIATCRERGISMITSGGASARLDPLSVKLVDLAKTHSDPLCHQVRKILRQRYAFPKDGEFGIPCVFSDEEPMMPVELNYDNGEGFKCVCPQGQNDFHSCDKRRMIYGTASFMTGNFGFVMASFAVRHLVRDILNQKSVVTQVRENSEEGNELWPS